jgi:uncharacterized protein (TIGR02391 family)
MAAGSLGAIDGSKGVIPNSDYSSMATSTPPFNTRTLEQISRILGDAVSGSQLTRVFTGINLRDRSGESTKWKRIYYTLEPHQRQTGTGKALVGLLHAIMEPGGFSTSAEFGSLQRQVNVPLALSGLEVGQDGRVHRLSSAATTLDEAEKRSNRLFVELRQRDVHRDVLRYCRAELLQDNYFHAVLEAAKSVAEKIRDRTGLTEDGAELVDRACSLKLGMPPLAFNRLDNDSERSEHTGLAMLSKGFFATFRNTRAHAPRLKWATSLPEALDMLTLASMLHRRIDEAIVTPAAPAHEHHRES